MPRQALAVYVSKLLITSHCNDSGQGRVILTEHFIGFNSQTLLLGKQSYNYVFNCIDLTWRMSDYEAPPDHNSSLLADDILAHIGSQIATYSRGVVRYGIAVSYTHLTLPTKRIV